MRQRQWISAGKKSFLITKWKCKYKLKVVVVAYTGTVQAPEEENLNMECGKWAGYLNFAWGIIGNWQILRNGETFWF